MQCSKDDQLLVMKSPLFGSSYPITYGHDQRWGAHTLRYTLASGKQYTLRAVTTDQPHRLDFSKVVSLKSLNYF